MNQYAIYDPDDGCIICVVDASPGQMMPEGPLSDGSGHHVYHIKSREINPDEDRILSRRAVRKPKKMIADQDYKLEWASVKAIRHRLLTASDWTQGADSPLGENKRLEWSLYRQSLRDITHGTQDPKSVVWPTPPD